MAEKSDDGMAELVQYLHQIRVGLTGQAIITGAGQLTLNSQPSTLTGQGTVSDGTSSGELLIQAALVGFASEEAQRYIIHSVTLPWIEIINAIARDPLFLHTIHPRKLEELVAEAYTRDGYKDVILTPYSGDKGRDVIVSATLPGIGTVKIVDQVKRYGPRKKVKADDVRALAGVLLRDQDVSKGIVTTTSDFAPGIHEEFKVFFPTRLELKNGAALVQWLKDIHSKPRKPPKEPGD